MKSYLHTGLTSARGFMCHDLILVAAFLDASRYQHYYSFHFGQSFPFLSFYCTFCTSHLFFDLKLLNN